MTQHSASSARRVLIVEDESDALAFLHEWSKGKHWHVKTAQTGQAALELGRSFEPDILITDYFLGDHVTGVDVIERLRASNKKLVCILMTGSLQTALLEGVRRLHGVPILTKPFDLQRLAALISAKPLDGSVR